MTRILLTTDSVGGVFTYAVDLVRRLSQEGVEAVVVNLGPPLSPDQHAELGTSHPAALHQIPGRLEWMQDPWEDLASAAVELRRLAARERVDLVHASAFFCGTIEWGVPCLVVAHSCVVSWWNAVHGTDPPPAWRRYRELVRAGLAGADAVVAPSSEMAAALARHYGPLPVPVRVIHNGTTAAPAGAADKATFALAAGRVWDEAKNLEVLEAVAPLLSAPVLVAGERAPAADGLPGADPLPGRPGELAAGRVRWLGRLPARELAVLRRRAAVFTAPALYEPFGLGILEAALDGCALVLGDIPSLREIWGDAALYAPARDATGLAAHLEALLETPDRAASLGRAARRRARRYSAGAMAAAYRELYEILLARREVLAA